MRLELEQYMQDIIMGTKGYYSLNDEESNLDRMKRITQSIHGGSGEEYLDTVNHWMYEVYDELSKHDNVGISKYNLRDFMLGRTYEQREHDKGAMMNAFTFLYNEISLCTVSTPYFKLVLTLNDALAYESDYIREERKNYSIKVDVGGETVSLFYKDELIKTVARGGELHGYSLLSDLEIELATKTVRERAFESSISS